MKQKIRNWFENLLLKERSVKKLSASFCFGTFIALSPTIPLQTPLVIALSWLFGLNIGVATAALYVVNNPLTMIPIYAIGYAIGLWFFSTVVRIDLLAYNPWWVDRFNAYLSKFIDVEKYLGTELCFWCLIIGGFIFATCTSLALYPLLTRALTRLAAQLEKKRSHESSSTK